MPQLQGRRCQKGLQEQTLWFASQRGQHIELSGMLRDVPFCTFLTA